MNDNINDLTKELNDLYPIIAGPHMATPAERTAAHKRYAEILELLDEAKAEADRERLLNDHLATIQDDQAEIYNLGWATGENFIHSKTSRGRLYSAINYGVITHTWERQYAA